MKKISINEWRSDMVVSYRRGESGNRRNESGAALALKANQRKAAWKKNIWWHRAVKHEKALVINGGRVMDGVVAKR